jgi:hypothetical protein
VLEVDGGYPARSRHSNSRGARAPVHRRREALERLRLTARARLWSRQ